MTVGADRIIIRRREPHLRRRLHRRRPRHRHDPRLHHLRRRLPRRRHPARRHLCRDALPTHLGSATELIAPAKVIGTRTEECIRAGVVFGAVESLDGIVRRIKREWPRAQVPKVIATGGLAAVIKPWCNEIELVEPDLTLHGLRMAHAMLAGQASAAARSASTGS
jgi:hypothetical protein